MKNFKIAPIYTLTVILQFITLSAIAQNNNLPYYNYYSAYSQQRRDGAAANKALSESVMNARNTPSGSYQPITFSKEEEAKINAQWDAIFHPSKGKQTFTAEEQARMNKAEAAFYRDKNYYEDNLRNTIEQYKKPIKKYLNYFGFSDFEASYMCENEIYYKTHGEMAIKKAIENKGLIFETVNEYLNQNNITFETIASNINAVIAINAPYTALQFCDVTEKKFPLKAKEIDDIRINALFNFFDNYDLYNKDDYSMYTSTDITPYRIDYDTKLYKYDNHATEYAFITKTYLALEDKYPSVYSRFAINARKYNIGCPYDIFESWRNYLNNPGYSLTIDRKDAKYEPVIKELFNLGSRRPKMEDMQDANYRAEYAMYEPYKTFKTITIDKVKGLAKEKNMKPSALKIKYYSQQDKFKIYKKIADEGDDDALELIFRMQKSMKAEDLAGIRDSRDWIKYLAKRWEMNNGSAMAMKLLITFIQGTTYDKIFETTLLNFEKNYSVEKTIEVARLLTVSDRPFFDGTWYGANYGNSLCRKWVVGFEIIAKYAALGNARAIELQTIFDKINKDPKHEYIVY